MGSANKYSFVWGCWTRRIKNESGGEGRDEIWIEVGDIQFEFLITAWTLGVDLGFETWCRSKISGETIIVFHWIGEIESIRVIKLIMNHKIQNILLNIILNP